MDKEAWWAPGPVWTGAENLAPNGIRSPDRPARSHSLYLAHTKHVHMVYYFVSEVHALILTTPREFLTVPQYTQAPRLQANFRIKRI